MIRKVSDSPVRWQAECDRCGRPFHRPYHQRKWAVAAPRRAGWRLDATTVLCVGCAGWRDRHERLTYDVQD